MNGKGSVIALALLLAGCGGTDGDETTPPHSANGTLGAFEPLNHMPHGRVGHCAFYAAGYLVVIGGIYKQNPTDPDFLHSDQIHVAKVEADGTLGSWSVAGTMPSPLMDCTGTSRDDELYLTANFDDDTYDQQLWTATLSSDGTVGDWEALSTLPAGYFGFGQHMFFRGSTLYATDYQLPNEGDQSVALHKDLDAGDAWGVDPWLPGFRGRPQFADSGDELFVIGGYVTGNDTVPDVDRGTIAEDGSVGDRSAQPPLPAPRNSGQAIAVDGFVFQLGGRELLIGELRDSVYVSDLAPDGTLSSWRELPSLPEPRSSFGLTLIGDYLYLTGGGIGGAGTDTVYRTQVRF